jgi:hypothetical protein
MRPGRRHIRGGERLRWQRPPWWFWDCLPQSSAWILPLTQGCPGVELARACALISGVVGIVANTLLIGFFTLANPYDATPGGPTWLGDANDVIGIFQFAAFAPVVWALRRRLHATRLVRVATVFATAAAIAFALLGVLLVIGVLTFEQQIGPVIVAIVVIYAWLLTANLAAHRFRTMPRAVTLSGTMLGVGFLVGLVLVGGSMVLPNSVGRIIGWARYALGGLCWLGLPIYTLLLAARVFTDREER